MNFVNIITHKVYKPHVDHRTTPYGHWSSSLKEPATQLYFSKDNSWKCSCPSSMVEASGSAGGTEPSGWVPDTPHRSSRGDLESTEPMLPIALVSNMSLGHLSSPLPALHLEITPKPLTSLLQMCTLSHLGFIL